MGKVTVEPDSLEHLLLYQADDDWLPIGTANFYAGFFEKDLARRKELVLKILRSLAQRGYVEIGHFVTDREASDSMMWAPLPGTLDEQLHQVSAAYAPESDDDFDWYWKAAMNITSRGRAVVEALPKPDSRFFEWAKRRKS